MGLRYEPRDDIGIRCEIGMAGRSGALILAVPMGPRCVCESDAGSAVFRAGHWETMGCHLEISEATKVSMVGSSIFLTKSLSWLTMWMMPEMSRV